MKFVHRVAHYDLAQLLAKQNRHPYVPTRGVPDGLGLDGTAPEKHGVLSAFAPAVIASDGLGCRGFAAQFDYAENNNAEVRCSRCLFTPGGRGS